MHRARRGGVLQIAERRNVLLVRLQRGQNRAELETFAGAGRRPFIHRRTMRRVVHDGAVRKIKEAGSQLGHRGGLGQSRAGRHHRIQKRQPQRHAGSFQHRSARNVLLCEEHVISLVLAPSGHGSVIAEIGTLIPSRDYERFHSILRRAWGPAPCLTESVAIDDSQNEGRQLVIIFRSPTHDGTHLRHIEIFQLAVDARTSSISRSRSARTLRGGPPVAP